MPDKAISLKGRTLIHAQALIEAPGELLLNAQEEGARVHFSGGPDLLDSANYLVFDIELQAEQSVCVMLDFWDLNTPAGEESNLWVKVGVLPNLRTRIAFPLARLDSREMFIAPTPGQLKMVVFGKPVARERVSHFSIGTVRTQMPCRLAIFNLHLADELPEFPLPANDRRVDAIGQYIPKRWRGTCGGEEEMTTCLQALYLEASMAPDRFSNPGWDAHGGDTGISFAATGFFRREKRDGRWFLVTPGGSAFFSNGIDCVTFAPGRVDGMEPFFTWLPDRADNRFAPCWSISRDGFTMFDFLKANLIRAFSDRWFECWCVITRHLLKKWGFNTIGNWSDPEFIRWAHMPYVWQMSDFPTTQSVIFRDFPDVCSEEYEKNSRRFAQQLSFYRDDPCLIGYFMRNEPTWAFVEGVCIAEELLANPGCFKSKDALIDTLREKYGTAERLNEAWGTGFADFDGLRQPIGKARALSPAAAQDLDAFSRRLYALYNSIPAKACKSVDPNHMNLGMRYGYISQPDIVAGWEHFDVFSINSYFVSPVEQTKQAASLMDIPIMVGEYHFGSLDSGMTATGLRAVETQAQRADAYRYFLEQGAAHSHFVGAHYFTLYDQPVLGRFDGENYQIGLLDVTHRPYEEFTAHLPGCHNATYGVIKGMEKPWDKKAREIPKVAY